MNYQEYCVIFDDILSKKYLPPPYDKEAYFNYTKLNITRMKRWDKQLVLNSTIVDVVKAIDKKQRWIFITEPWCGDAAHILPFVIKLAAHNSLINYDIQLRDNEPFLIENYLSAGKKSIPKFVVRDNADNDLFYCGPRPKPAQILVDELKTVNADAEMQKITLQNWYNADKGVSFCNELLALFNTL